MSKRYLPISLCLLLGEIHLFGRMKKSEWVIFNWSAVLALLVLATKRKNVPAAYPLQVRECGAVYGIRGTFKRVPCLAHKAAS